MAKERIPAPVDGKNVDTDWIETIFDNDGFARDARLMVGMINHCVVQVSWNVNTMLWQVSKELGYGEPLIAYMILEERLRKAETPDQNIYSMIQHGELGKYQIVQTFYFRDED